MKKTIVPLAVLVMLGLIALAFAADCVRMAGDARRRRFFAHGSAGRSRR